MGEKVTVNEAELREETLLIKRCALVVKGGRRFSFSAYVVVGNEKGVVGLGHGKAAEVASAIGKANHDARKNLFCIEVDDNTVPHPSKIKFGASEMIILPAKPGTGVIACTPVRAIMTLAGIHDVLTKSFGSNNPINLIKATVKGLRGMKGRKTVESHRGVKLA
ncbi:MAG: 30S ribosomal protein S5 [Planctomycetes bacterium]|nr:30S ribosomal protein S5 [Planctomycetota bacterium]